jgi:cytochrome c peroxidase
VASSPLMAAALAMLMVPAACGSTDPPSGPQTGGPPATAAGDEADHDAELAELRRFEDARRAQTDFEQQPSAVGSLGANPYQLRRLDGGRAVGLLRGADALVLLDTGGRELARAATPPSPTALALDRSGRIWVGGTGSGEVALYRAGAAGLEPEARFRVEGAWTVRALALASAGAWMYTADERTGLVTALEVADPARRTQRAIGRCHGPSQLASAGAWLVVNCMAEHALLAFPIDSRGRPAAGSPLRMEQDGPFWSLAAAAAADRVVVAAGGIEDHPLERQNGGFGYIDSFLYVYELPVGTGAKAGARRLAAIDLSAQGVVTPKWLTLELDARGGAVVRTAGYATWTMATLSWPRLVAGAPAPTVEARPFVPGTTDWSPARADEPSLAASPLLDGWVVVERGAPRLVPVAAPAGAPARSTESRIGEALFFTTLMAPWNRSDGKRSRFTCESCHFEAYGDGRVHFTGRGAVHSATKPLRGLFNNRPHFTRALDRTMTQMVNAEFRVANRWNGRDPWFSLAAADYPWLASIEGVPPVLSPVYLRRAFMSFLMDLTFEPNQAVRGRDRFSARERAGAALFRDRCESCHRARLVTEDPDSAVPFARWERLVLSPQGPLVWASAEYRKTGVEPYVHAEGARTTSLRRLHQKYPYFTNGSARSLADVVARAAWNGARFFHDGAPDGAALARLDAGQQAALLAFLELL